MNKKVSYADQYSCRTETKTKKKSYFEYYQDHTDDWMKIKLYFFVNEMSVTSTESNKKLLKALQTECLWCICKFKNVKTNFYS